MKSQNLSRNHGKSEEQLFEIQHESMLHQYIGIITRRKWTVLAIFTLVFGLAALYTFTAQPIYEANSLVLIDMKEGDNSNPVLDMTGSASANKITNELQAMKSKANAVAVAESLLGRKYLDESRKTILRIIRADVEDPLKDSLASVAAVARRVKGTVEFTPVRESDIIKITARSADPEEAALIANLYTSIYMSRNMALSRTRTQALREFLESQVNAKRSLLDTTESDLQQYMRQTGVVSLDVETNRTVEHLAQLEAQREALEIERRSRLKMLSSYKEELTRQEPNAARAIAESNDSYIRLLQEQLGKLEVQRDITIAQNPGTVQQKLYSDKLLEINGQIDEIKRRLGERTQSYLKSIQPEGLDHTNVNSSYLAQLKGKIIDQQIELQGIEGRIHALDAVIGDSERKFNLIPQKNMGLAKLQRARVSTEKLFLLVEEKYNEAAIKEKSQFGNVNVMEQADVPLTPVSPKVAVNLVIGFILGLGLGIGSVILQAMMDRFVRTPEDLKRCGFIPLSTITKMNGEVKKIEKGMSATKTKRLLDPHLITHYSPLSPTSESYRHLRAKIQYARTDNAIQCLVITSCNPKEGKSTTSANLAVAFAQTEKKVLLVDADMRRSSVHAMFGLRNKYGLYDVLLDRMTSEDAIQAQVLPNLDILSCGTLPLNPAEILGSLRMKEFIAQMRQHYDMVIFDAPPLLAVTDAAVLATQTDGVLLVASAGETYAAGLQRIAEFLTSLNVNLLGVVLNRFDARKAYGNVYSSYASYHYGYYGYNLGTGKKIAGTKKIKS